jgi:hypothetical protein
MVVLAGIGIVHIGQLRDIHHFFVGHFQNGKTNRHIVGCSQVVPLIVLEVGLLNVQEQLGVKCSEVTGHEGIASVLVALDDRGWKRSGVAYCAFTGKEVSVDEPGSFLLKDCIEQF